MVEFDKDGWFTKQVVKIEVKHENDHDRFYPKIKSILESILDSYRSKYFIRDHTTHKNYIEEDLHIISLHKTNYKGKKYKEWNKEGSGALAIISKSIKSGNILIIKILIPKKGM